MAEPAPTMSREEYREYARTGKVPDRFTADPITPPTHAPAAAPAPSKHEVAEERVMHTLACQELNRREIGFIHAKMNKRSTLPVGWPDFTIFQRGGVWLAEFKTPTGIVSTEQKDRIERLTAAGFSVFIPRSFEEFRSILIARETDTTQTHV